MHYYTQLIFIKKGMEAIFDSFEEKVLPFLSKYNGELLYRIRPGENAIIEANADLPYEFHLVTFKTREDFERYKADDERMKFLSLKDQSVEKIILIEGTAL